MFRLELRQGLTAGISVHIKHHETGSLSCNDSNIGGDSFPRRGLVRLGLPFRALGMFPGTWTGLSLRTGTDTVSHGVQRKQFEAALDIFLDPFEGSCHCHAALAAIPIFANAP